MTEDGATISCTKIDDLLVLSKPCLETKGAPMVTSFPPGPQQGRKDRPSIKPESRGVSFPLINERSVSIFLGIVNETSLGKR